MKQDSILEKIFFWISLLAVFGLVSLFLFLLNLLFKGGLGEIIVFLAIAPILFLLAGIFVVSVFAYSLIWFFRDRKNGFSYSRRILILFLSVTGISLAIYFGRLVYVYFLL